MVRVFERLLGFHGKRGVFRLVNRTLLCFRVKRRLGAFCGRCLVGGLRRKKPIQLVLESLGIVHHDHLTGLRDYDPTGIRNEPFHASCLVRCLGELGREYD